MLNTTTPSINASTISNTSCTGQQTTVSTMAGMSSAGSQVCSMARKIMAVATLVWSLGSPSASAETEFYFYDDYKGVVFKMDDTLKAANAVSLGQAPGPIYEDFEVDQDGNLYFYDDYKGVLFKMDPTLDPSKSVSLGQVPGPIYEDFEVGQDGNLYFYDDYKGVLFKMDPTLDPSKAVSLGQVPGPIYEDFEVGQDGNLYFYDDYQGVLFKMDPTLDPSKSVSLGQVPGPIYEDFEIDNEGNLYFYDDYMGVLFKMDPTLDPSKSVSLGQVPGPIYEKFAVRSIADQSEGSNEASSGNDSAETSDAPERDSSGSHDSYDLQELLDSNAHLREALLKVLNPENYTDSDRDGLVDAKDAWPDSDLRSTVYVGRCDTGIVNLWFEDGSTTADNVWIVMEVAYIENRGTGGTYVSDVTDGLSVLVRHGIITTEDLNIIIALLDNDELKCLR